MERRDSHLRESLGGIERGEEGEGHSSNKDAPADQKQINDVPHLHVEL